MSKVKITPNTAYTPGHVDSLLALVAPGPMLKNQDGTVTVKMTEPQLEAFVRRGGAAHKIEVLPEPDPLSPAGDTGPAAESGTPAQVQADPAGTFRKNLEEYVSSRRNQGLSDEEIVQEMVGSGWNETQARQHVAETRGIVGPPAA